MKLAATSRPFPSVSWMVASLVRAWLRLFCLVRQSISRRAKFGTIMYSQVHVHAVLT